MIKHIDHGLNERGTDYFVGDIHGQFAMLTAALKRIDFDESCDRLFSVGDLVDRGPDSLQCLALVQEPWFYAVLGNHEDLMLDALTADISIKEYAFRLWERNGGGWSGQCSADEKRLCIELARRLPLARTISTDGLKHWDCPRWLEKTLV